MEEFILLVAYPKEWDMERGRIREFWGFILYNSVQFPPTAGLYYFYNKRKKTTKNNQLSLSVFLELKEIKKLNSR